MLIYRSFMVWHITLVTDNKMWANVIKSNRKLLCNIKTNNVFFRVNDYVSLLEITYEIWIVLNSDSRKFAKSIDNRSYCNWSNYTRRLNYVDIHKKCWPNIYSYATVLFFELFHPCVILTMNIRFSVIQMYAFWSVWTSFIDSKEHSLVAFIIIV